jgi:hypothetical protein
MPLISSIGRRFAKAKAGGPAPGPPPGQLLTNSDFLSGTTGWTASPGFGTFSYSSASRPAVTTSIDYSSRAWPGYSNTGSTGYLVFSYAAGIVSQTVSVSATIALINTFTGVINLINVPNPSGSGADSFYFEVLYKDSGGTTLYTSRTPASGTQAPPNTYTSYTLTLTRSGNPNFGQIASATVNIYGIDNNFWNGNYGPCVDYCRLTAS